MSELNWHTRLIGYPTRILKNLFVISDAHAELPDCHNIKLQVHCDTDTANSGVHWHSQAGPHRGSKSFFFSFFVRNYFISLITCQLSAAKQCEKAHSESYSLTHSGVASFRGIQQAGGAGTQTICHLHSRLTEALQVATVSAQCCIRDHWYQGSLRPRLPTTLM